MSIEITNFWAANTYNHPPLTPRMVEEAEQALGVKLPAALLELLYVQNGGYTQGFAHPMTQPTSWAEDHVPFLELFGLAAQVPTSAQNMLDTPYMTQEWGLPEKQVLLCGEGHWWLTLDYRAGPTPSVTWLNPDSEQDILVAPSFQAFLAGLVPEDTFAS